MANRAAIAQAVKSSARAVGSNGGTTAPRSAANSPSTGLGGRKPALGQWNPQGETGKTAYAQGMGKPAAPGAAPPAASPYTPAPWDSQYELSAAGARQKYANTVNNLGLKKTATEQDFGLGNGYNDYQSNPYSRAALLEQTYQKANRGTGNSYAASGQLYAGSLSTALDANRQAEAQSHDSLEKEYRNALQSIRDEEVAAKNAEIGELGEAGWNRLERADSAPLDSSTAPEPAKTAAKASKPKAASSKKTVIKEAVSKARKAK